MRAASVSDAQTAALATLGGMVSTVAHEVRNLLGPIDLYASLLAEQCAPSPELAQLSARLLAGVKQLGAVAGNLLAVSRRPLLDRAPVDLDRLVVESVESVALSTRATGIAFRTRLGAGKACVLGDADRLRQAILNVLLNAVQALSDRGSVTVALDAHDGEVELRIRDTGPGMERATLARATEPFFTTRPTGTGLGLAVVREVAELHQARLRITSRRGSGTTVRLTFPLHETGPVR